MKKTIVTTRNRVYTIEHRPDGDYIQGHPQYCPEFSKGELNHLQLGDRMFFALEAYPEFNTSTVQDIKKEDSDKPKIVCLCGSTRFYPQFQQANYELTMAGCIVLSVGFYPHAVKEMHHEAAGCTPAQKVQLDELHKRKIDLCDEVYVLNVGGYIGESTRSEIEYAIAHGKPVRYLESV